MKSAHHSLTTFRLFVHAAGSLSFSATARANNLTQSAVSKHIAAIEAHLGTALFERSPRGLLLTGTGRSYVEKIAAALSIIDDATAAVSHRTPLPATTINVAVSPSFAQFCLIPALPGFFREYPTVVLNLRPRLNIARSTERFDAEIHLSSTHEHRYAGHYLAGRDMAFVTAPSLLAGRHLRQLRDLEALPLLKRAQSGYEWEEWIEGMGSNWSGPPAHSAEYEGFSVLLPAVLNGLGGAIFPLCLVNRHLESGALVRPLAEEVRGRYAYFFSSHHALTVSPGVAAFREWLFREFGEDSPARPHSNLE